MLTPCAPQVWHLRCTCMTASRTASVWRKKTTTWAPGRRSVPHGSSSKGLDMGAQAGCDVMHALGLVEIRGFSPAMVALDLMAKSGEVALLQVELNDLYGVCIKVTGGTADVEAAVAAGRQIAAQM